MSEAFSLACDGYGKCPSDIMFVGISAGKRGALISKVPFTRDASGRLFQRALYQLGLSRTEDERNETPSLNCWVTNLVKGRLLDEKGNNRPPTPQEIHYWAPHLIGEIEKVQPKILVAVGKIVFKNLVVVPWPMMRDRGIEPRTVMHPRWYHSHGALDPNSEAWKKMLKDYDYELNARWREKN